MHDVTTRDARPAITPIDRFWNFVTPGPFTDCWEWTGALRNGYGVLNVDGRVVYAHRFSYELHFGPIPDDMDICHVCDRRSCANPYHLFLGTRQDNVKDMYAKGRGKGGSAKGDPVTTLSKDDVLEIRKLAGQGIHYPAIAEQFGITIPSVSLIVTRKRWGHVP